MNSSASSVTTSIPSLLLQKSELPPLENLEMDLLAPLPSECFQIKANSMFHERYQPTMLSENALLSTYTTSKKAHDKVYSGSKSRVSSTVPSLSELCKRILQKNVEKLKYTRGAPFEVLKPVLEQVSPEQLTQIEHLNSNLMEKTHVLWQQHCQRKFKAYKRQEMETWREMFNRCQSEQQARLNQITKKILKSQTVTIPRQIKLANVDSMAKPPRNIIKKQNQLGTQRKMTATPAARVDALSSPAANYTRPTADTQPKTTSSMGQAPQARPSNGYIKPKKAPLMAKTLRMLKYKMRR
ncbi:transcription elongation factor B polypeptide 3-like [Contarinia nasturtii]|uniref:transcription elongation factor B polypeptide 3-like n=1 Tax=Contarinia nasturtii TaxID=265458 RepID=UPI0012D41BA5|nr:transcription elongation factor B polypeptide 3-like [Contarinia nasturtii]